MKLTINMEITDPHKAPCNSKEINSTYLSFESCTFVLNLYETIPNVKSASNGPDVIPENAIPMLKTPPSFSTTKTNAKHMLPMLNTSSFRILLAFFSVISGYIGFIKSSYIVPDREFKQVDMVDSAADKAPTMKSPGSPGIERATSIT